MGQGLSLITHRRSLFLKAPAKINWFLKILGLRDDGFHEIQSLMQKITLHDELSFAPSADLLLKTNADIPVEQNLVYKAAKLLQQTHGIKEGALISLKKNIPSGAGLGGGSSDAASTLAGLNELWSLRLSREELCKAAEQLGSDVPFFLGGSISFASGKGEKIAPCKTEKTATLLLVKPPFPVSTAWVYGEMKKIIQNTGASLKSQTSTAESPELTKKADKVDNIKFLIHSIERAEFKNVADIVSNDLEPVTLKTYPVIAEIKKRLKRQGAIFSLMSGSGSTVFGVFNSSEDAEDAGKAFGDYWTAVVQTITD